MTSRRFSDVEEVFREALRRDATERLAFVQRRCAGDAVLLDEVLALLDEDARTRGALDRAAFGAAVSVAAITGGVSLTPVPERIGGYRIVRRLGRGGMGLVYEAEQEGLRRRVALKVIEADAATPDSLRRFQHEAELLARLQHPGIAQIYESGQFDDCGQMRPFLVMELVDGVPVTTYARALDLRSRIDLLARICDAVQHAHQRGVIHRDLKPSNILAEPDGRPRILDFGVARAIDGHTLATSMHTGAGQLVGTLAYMSPEQAAGATNDIDTRSDIYALGVLGYEMLVGRLPHDPRGHPMHEVARTIIEVDPPSPRSVDRSLSGDVDVILRKALAKRPVDRYQSASELASDLRRHLQDEPILARAPGTWDHVRRLARRYRGVLALACTALAFLVLALGATVWGYVTAVEARDRQKTLTAAAERESRLSVEIVEFARAMIGAIEPNVAGDSDTTLLRRILDDAARRIDENPNAAPEVESSIRSMVGFTYRAIGEVDSAKPHLERALLLYEQHLGANSRRTIEAMENLAGLRRDEGRLDEAASLYREALRRLPSEGPEADPLRLMILNNLSFLLRIMGSLDEASEHLVFVIRVRRESLGNEHPDTLTAIHNLGAVRRGQGLLQEAEALFRTAYEGRERVLGADHVLTSFSAANLGIVLQNLGRLEEAETLARRAFERCVAVLGPTHPSTLRAEMNLGVILSSQAKYEESAKVLRHVADAMGASLGTEHPETILPYTNLAAVERACGRPAEALAILEDVVLRAARALGPGHEQTVQAATERTLALLDLDRTVDALSQAEESLSVAEANLRPAHPERLRAVGTLGIVLIKLGRIEEAERRLRAAYEGRRVLYGPTHALTRSSRDSLVKCLQRMGRDEEANALANTPTD